MGRSVDEGWGLWTLREDVDTGTASGRLFVHIMGAVAEFASSISSDRIKSAMKEMARQGAVFGRLRDLDEGVRALIVADLAAGLTASQVARNLTDEGVPTARGGQWWPGSVREIGLAAGRPAPNGIRGASKPRAEVA